MVRSPSRCYISSKELSQLRNYAHYLWANHGLKGRCEPEDLVNETIYQFCTAVRRSQQGHRPIEHRLAFLKVIAYRCSTHMLESSITERNLIARVKEQTSEQDTSSSVDWYPSALLAEARQHLKDEENELIALRVDQQMEWSQICEYYRQQNKLYNPALLRKRFERIKLKLATFLLQRGIDRSCL